MSFIPIISAYIIASAFLCAEKLSWITIIHQPYPVEEINNAVTFEIPVCYNRSLPVVSVEAKRVLLKHQCILNYYGLAEWAPPYDLGRIPYGRFVEEHFYQILKSNMTKFFQFFFSTLGFLVVYVALFAFFIPIFFKILRTFNSEYFVLNPLPIRSTTLSQ